MKIDKAEVIATGKPRHIGWEEVPDGCKTKTQWGTEGMRPKAGVSPTAYVYINGRTHFALYDTEAVTPKAVPTPGVAKALTPENIGAALFEINKGAKRRRDAASQMYDSQRHSLAGIHKEKKEAYYELKDDVIREASRSGLATLVGYHTKYQIQTHRQLVEPIEYDNDRDEDDSDDPNVIGNEGYEPDAPFDDSEDRPKPKRYTNVTSKLVTHMACYELGGFRFHTIIDSIPEQSAVDVADLGEWLSKATPRSLHMPLKDAIATLDAYLLKVKRAKVKH